MGNNNIKSLTSRKAVSRLTTHLRTGARVSSPSSGVRPGARALNLELPTSFGISLLVGVLGLLFGGLFLSHSAYAASYLNVSSGGAVSLGSIRPTSSGTSSTGSDTLTVHTDCSTGYSVYVSGQNGKDTNLTNESASANNTISTSSNAIGSASGLSSNTWGLNHENTGNYSGLPTYADSTNKALTSKADVAESSTVPIYYGVKVDTSLTPGTYTGDVLYTVLMDSSCLAYTVIFNSNGGSGTMANQSIMAGTKTALDESAFTRDGYTFLGWSTKANGKTETAVDGVGTEADVDYADQAEVTDLTSGGSSITLYAIWGQDVESMQSWKGCPSLAVGESAMLKDVRDNKKYAVKKLPDGKCWMMQNLTIGSTVTTDTGLALTKDDTNIDDDVIYYLPPAGKQSTGTITQTPNVGGTPGDSNFIYGNADDAHAKTRFRAAGGGKTNDTDTGYYNFYTATLGFSSSYQDDATSGSSTRDICPKNWRLPRTTDAGTTVSAITTVNDFTYLARQYSTSNWTSAITSYDYYTTDATAMYSMRVWEASPLATTTQNNYAGFSYTGTYSGKSLNNLSSVGYYWSSSVYSATASYELVITSSAVYPQNRSDKYYGSAVRCIYDAYDTMQDFDVAAFSDTVGDSTELKDTRDSKIYTVKRLPDGKVWMMQNLTIGMDGAKTLTPADTNIDNGTTYYLPPAGKQGSSTIDDPSTLTATATANFSKDSATDQHAKTQFRTKGASYSSSASGYINDSDTGYYNFYTATLGFTYYGGGVSAGSSTRDVCPKGWRLPWTSDSGLTRQGSADFYTLALAYNSDPGVWTNYLAPTGTGLASPYTTNANVYMGLFTSAASPIGETSTRNGNAGFSNTGHQLNTSTSGVGSFGYYWSSSAYTTAASYRMSFQSSSSEISPQYASNTYYGYAIRCIAQSSYTINYSSDGATSGEPEKATEGKVYENGSIILPSAGTMARDGYAFKGWALISGASDPAYAAGETVSLSALLTAASSAGQSTTPGSTFTLYPVWKAIPLAMQDFNCYDLAAGTSTTLRDARDDQEYTVYRFPTDVKYAGTSTVANVAGKCIMTKDLNLGAVASVSGASSTIEANGEMSLSPSDSSFTTPTGSGESITVPTSNVTVNSIVTSGWNNTDGYSNKQYIANGTGNYSGRGYYSWGAAMVACPKNWRLPTSDEYNNSDAWNTSTSGISYVVGNSLPTLQGSPYSFVLGGYYDNDGGSYATQFGYYWSSTQYNASSSYSLYMFSSLGLLQNYSGKRLGYSVRCIADPPTTYTLSYSGVDFATTNKPETQTYTGYETSHTFTLPSAKPTYSTTGTTLTFSNYTYNGTTYNAGSTITLSSSSPSATLTANWTRSCTISSSTGCKLADNKTWIYGNSGKEVTWDDLCTSSDNCKVSTYCPSSYQNIPTETAITGLRDAYGNNGALYQVLGLSTIGGHPIWSSTQHTRYTSAAHALYITSSSADVSYALKTSSRYILCYKQS